MKKKKIIIIIVIILIFSFPIYQLFIFAKTGGNLILYISNQSEVDTVGIELFLNNEKEIDDYYTNYQFHNYKRYVFKTTPGNQAIAIKTKVGNTKLFFDVNTWLIKWVAIDYSEIINKKGEKEYFFVVRQNLKPFLIN